MYIYNNKIIATFSKHFYQNVHNPDESLKSFFNYISHLLKISRLTKLRSSMHMSEFKIWKDRRKVFLWEEFLNEEQLEIISVQNETRIRKSTPS